MNFDEKRFFRVKNPSQNFLCALCSSPRQMKYKRNLSIKNYLQLTLLGGSLTYFLFPFFGAKSLFLTFIIWMVAEVTNKILYRNELPCPYCGFDATWYRRDVKVAKQKVEHFWSTRNSSKNIENNEAGESTQAQVNNSNLNNQEAVNNNAVGTL